MDCPECDGSLTTYVYRDREASVCERCGYVGIVADHEGEPVEVESWDEALRRFREGEGTDDDRDVSPTDDDRDAPPTVDPAVERAASELVAELEADDGADD